MPLTTIGTIESATELGQLVGIFYSYALEIAGLCVFLVVVYAGFSYMFGEVSGGSAQTIVQNAVIGLVLLYSAYIILSAISCDLVGSSGCSSNISSSTPTSGGGAASPFSGAAQPPAQQPLPTFQGQGGSFGGGGATGSF